MKRTTIRDVAAASGVSPATVSFVLNESRDQTISAATRTRVLQTAEQLGYTPNGIAKALVEGSSRIVVLNFSSELAGNYATGYIAGLDAELAGHGYVLLVRHEQAAADDRLVLDAINPKAVLQFGNVYATGHELEDFGRGWRDGMAAHAAVQIRYLAQRGHRSLAFAVPAADAPLADPRLRFSNRTAASLAMPPLVPFAVPATRDGAREAVAEMRAGHPQITAVAALEDDTAIRVLAALSDLGLAVPDDVAVIGYDDAGHGEFSSPPLTTVHIDAEAHGRMSARDALGLDHTGLQLTPGSVLVRSSA